MQTPFLRPQTQASRKFYYYLLLRRTNCPKCSQNASCEKTADECLTDVRKEALGWPHSTICDSIDSDGILVQQ